MTESIDLFGFEQTASRDEIKQLRKRDLRNLLTSYADEADVFTEIIQNAFDTVIGAIDAGLYGGDERPEISIVIGRRQGGDPHYLFVADNGMGMNPETARNFTMPGYSRQKKLGKTVGYKGVGATFFFAASNKISFFTKDIAGEPTESTVTGAFSWIMSLHEPEPVVAAQSSFPNAVRPYVPDKHGTALYYEFHSGLKPKSLSNIVIKTDEPQKELKNWACFLAAKTALGQVNDISKLRIRVRICLDDGETLTSSSWSFGLFDKDNNVLGYPYPWRVFKVHKDLKEIQATPEGQREWAHKNKHQALRLYWTNDDILRLDPLIDFTVEERELIDTHFEFIDVFFAYSTDVMTEIHNRFGTRSRQFRYGIRMACAGVPQGRMIDFDLTSNQGLSRQAHAVLSFKDLELDTGRKIPSNEAITEVIRKLGVRAMTALSNYRWAMKKRQRPDPSYDIDSWRSSTKERMSSSIVKALFERLNKQPPIQVEPDTENDVIALFSALLANGIIKGYELLALSGFNRYDGLITIKTEPAGLLQDHADVLSIRDTSNNRGGGFKVLEFKLQFEAVLEDFEENKKNPTDIDLLVCWTLPSLNVQRGSIQYTYGDRNDYREIYAMSHLWMDENGTTSIPIIALKHVIAEKLKQMEAGEPGLGTARFNEILDQERNASI